MYSRTLMMIDTSDNELIDDHHIPSCGLTLYESDNYSAITRIVRHERNAKMRPIVMDVTAWSAVASQPIKEDGQSPDHPSMCYFLCWCTAHKIFSSATLNCRIRAVAPYSSKS